MRKIQFILLSLVIVIIASCQSKPTEIKSKKKDEPQKEGSILQNSNNAHHTISINEVLQANKYTYLNVKENNEDFWIAIPKREVQSDVIYHYSGGLKKTNFYSPEFNRTFPLIYLVSGLHEASSHDNKSAIDQAISEMEVSNPTSPMSHSEGSIPLSDIFTDKTKYSGKRVKVKGKCVKVNNQIMGRNWIHIQDGTSDNGTNYDLTITTQEIIPLGSTVIMEGIIALNKDFGAGYRYDIIMEEANNQ
jgi:hypothetical protein